MTEWVSVAVVARRLGVSRQTVRRLVRRGDLVAVKKTGRGNSPYLIDEVSVAMFEARRRAGVLGEERSA